MTGAGSLNDLVLFRARTLDDNDQPIGPWADLFDAWAEVIYQRGSEGVVHERLSGRQPAVFLIYDTPEARALTEGCAVLVYDTGVVFNITAIAPARERGFLSLQAVSGVAEG